MSNRHDSIVVIGACGRVGLPFCLIAAEAGFNVIGIDKNYRMIQQLYNTYKMPYVEVGAQPLLENHLGNKFNLYPELKGVNVDNVKYVVVMIGTPIDEFNNPRVDDIYSVFEDIKASKISKDVLVILRSTVSPKTTDELIYQYGPNIVFAPERVSQGYAISEHASLPQLIGAKDDAIFWRAAEFFTNLGCQKIIDRMTPLEAEYAKLVTNMYRYVNFAFSNEVYMLATKAGADAHKIIEGANLDYPRMSMPLPGPNVGGPCLYKDGQFLVSEEPFVDMIRIAFQINESMPAFIYSQIKGVVDRPVLILGTTFKAENDDTRNSLAYKFIKILKKHNVKYRAIDPFVNREDWEDGLSDVDQYGAIVVFTPHKQCKIALEKILETKKTYQGYIVADPWKITDKSKQYVGGIWAEISPVMMDKII
jgi:UDP-N-acetyl-D-mannosaminuronic acid dehydrogenase